jgi:hypothetical protein
MWRIMPETHTSMNAVKKSLSRFGKVLFYCLILIPLVESFAEAQDSSGISRENYFWLSGGFGAGTSGGAAGVIISWQSGRGVLSIRYTYNEEINIFGPDPPNAVEDVGVLYGIALVKAPRDLVAISAGISSVSGVRRGRYLGNYGLFSDKYEKSTYKTIGVVLHGQFLWTPTPYFGLGLDVPVDLNREQSFIAVQLSLQIGLLR